MHGLKRAIGDKEKLRIWMEAHGSSLKAWASFIAVVTIVFFTFSDGDYSFLLTLSSIIGMFSFLMVVLKIERNRNCAGVSLKMIECYVVLLFARLCSIIPFEGYLPYDRTGDWLYQSSEAIAFCLAGTIVYLCRSRYKDTYAGSADTFYHIALIVPALILAIFFHASLNAFLPADIAWSFALYLEAVACLPQLFMFQKQGRVEAFTSHFLAAQALSKVMAFLFWLSTHGELNDSTTSLKNYVGYWVMAMQVLQLIVMGDFIYHYVRCLSRGLSVQYILTDTV